MSEKNNSSAEGDACRSRPFDPLSLAEGNLASKRSCLCVLTGYGRAVAEHTGRERMQR